MLNCKLCDSTEYVYSGYLCSKCIKIQDIIKICGVDKVEESLKFIFVRDDIPIKNRVESAKTGDASYIVAKEKKTKM